VVIITTGFTRCVFGNPEALDDPVYTRLEPLYRRLG
jgi:hypothetical protein